MENNEIKRAVDAVVFALAGEMTEMGTSERIALVEAVRKRLAEMARDLRAHVADEREDEEESDGDLGHGDLGRCAACAREMPNHEPWCATGAAR